MTQTMRAIVLKEPGPVENLVIKGLPIPKPKPGWIRIAVKAFGLNRSELYTRLGFSPGVTFPRILGIEAVGIVDLDTSGRFKTGTQVMTMMGGMGRTFDGGYAEYVCVPADQVLPFESNLEWAILGALPEMIQTAYGSLTIGMNMQAGQTMLIRGGTSSVGMTSAILAKRMANVTVISTTRSPEKAAMLKDIGVDQVIIDDGEVAGKVRELFAEGVDCALELVGTPTLRDTLAATKVHGTVCFTGMLSNQWTVKDFYPIDFLPNGVRLTAYSGEAADLPREVLQDFLNDIASGKAKVPLARIFHMDDIRKAHSLMESGEACGKIVVITD